MNRINYWAVGAAAVVTLVASSVYYMVFGGVWASLRGVPTAAPQPWELAGQLGRNLVEVLVMAVLLSRLQIRTRREAAGFGLLVWLGFQAMMIAGSVLHESYPVGLYVLHVGDALMTTLLVVLILSTWRRGRQATDGPGQAVTVSCRRIR
ncbi:DUF1761 domain-containing protein [Nonomuraea jabiensis]|uniref:DUF1761 domain-containing protein n=1 Tax=Nonomuraea jabiensis TaxID=882448 RepID=A0A7W9G1H5_9ACTN|nr:DUF1761 domain-containing protein [Nonomuraea jabiensis]MBB5775359.1 hypothetical protein [Nonomuraea jabiensis]